ncbi:hypothetical protein SAMN05216559_2286 [Halomicrobium zhouii]|uniref:Uncharacterized protein n=1 Tax=Halomicrobium zhouii TaxID=767519 RepID=A0A1I6L8Y1_9EURY|nr:hypothetical protein [Halomicrobium zhouii]SFR99953.1 hypothetical protein SAMN05216559_2286 [Halomicrobium zhouii]
MILDPKVIGVGFKCRIIMKRGTEIQECRNILTDETPDHLHIRRKVIVEGFTDDLQSELEEFNVISIDISEWDHAELMETLRYELQRELSTIKYIYSRIKNVGASFGAGFSAGVEARPDYSRTNDYLHDVSNRTEDNLIVFVNYHGKRPVDNFGWIPKLDIPGDSTIITDGYTDCKFEDSIQFEIGRLSKKQAVSYLTHIDGEVNEEKAAEIHRIHDGNPVAIEIAAERGSLRKKLSGEALQELWASVYEDKISGDELDLLTDSAHLIDLDQRDVASVTDKTRGEAKEILTRLRSKGVVSQKKSGLFTTDKYVKLYTSTKLTGDELSKQHQMSFHDYAEKWVDAHESRMQEMQNQVGGTEEDETISPRDMDPGHTDPNLFLAIHHLSKLNEDMDKGEFIRELEEINGDPSGVFAFGLTAQRFFFEDPTEILQDLSESILGIEGDVENELFSGTLGVLFGFDIQAYANELASGWSGDVNTENLDLGNVSNPDDVVERIQRMMNSDLFEDLPNDVNRALATLIALGVTDSRTAREYYNRFGKTAEKYGLEEDPFCHWLDEIEHLVEELTPELEGEPDQEKDPFKERFDSLDKNIRDRIELREMLEETHTEAQQRLQQRLDLIRDRPNEIADEYIKCGEHLENMNNNIYALIWYAIGHELFAKVVLDGENRKLFAKYNRLAGQRDEQEKAIPNDEIVLSRERVEEVLGDMG